MNAAYFDHEYRARLRRRRRMRRHLKDVALTLAMIAALIILLSADAWLVGA